MGFCENNPRFTGAPALAVKLIKCARIYGLYSEMKRINRGPKMDGCWKMMMPRTLWGGGRRVTALGGRSWRGIEGFDTITHPQTTAGPVVGCNTFWASLELSDFLHFQPICTFSLHATVHMAPRWSELWQKRGVLGEQKSCVCVFVGCFITDD